MRTILITGVSTGIGRAIAEELLKTEEFYIIGSVREKGDAAYLSEKFEKLFHEVIFDVTNKEEIMSAKKEVVKVLEDNKTFLSCLINNAGIVVGGPVRYLDVNHFRKQF